jgi:hypothetical protein
MRTKEEQQERDELAKLIRSRRVVLQQARQETRRMEGEVRKLEAAIANGPAAPGLSFEIRNRPLPGHVATILPFKR